MELQNRIQQNAELRAGPCSECPAQNDQTSTLVNPGLGNLNGNLVFVSEEPRHLVDWNEYESWEEYNEEWMPRFAEASGGRMINRLLERTPLNIDDVWITDSVKCPTKRDEAREIPAVETESAFECCRTYLHAELEAIDPTGIITLGKQATSRTLEMFGFPEWKAKRIQVTKEYGQCPFDTSIPIVISLHWAQRTIEEDEWVPAIQEAIADLLSEEP